MNSPINTAVNLQIMSAQRRKFSDQEKLDVLRQASQVGITTVLRDYNLSYSVYTNWKKKFLERGIDFGATKLETRLLQEENARLKKIIADLSLSLELKNEELKRRNPFNENRGP